MPELIILEQPKQCYLCARGSQTVIDKVCICVQCIDRHLDYQVSETGSVTKIFREKLQQL